MDNNKKDTPASPFSDKISKAESREQNYEEIVTEINNYPDVQQLMMDYAPSSVESFIKHYAMLKTSILEWGEFTEKHAENNEMQWDEIAYNGLIQIQQKKLFDLQCLWRAGNIDLDGVLICNDFSAWEFNVMNCPFLPPVTQQEVDLYILYLQSNNVDEITGMGSERWQDYEGIKEAYNTDDADRNFPEWYDFYNSRMGTGVYMTLPDTRGQLEDFYLRLSRELSSVRKLAESKQPEPPQAIKPMLPRLNYFDAEHLKWFVYTFEDKQTQEFAELNQAFRSIDDMDFDWQFDKDLLESTTEPISVKSWYNWKEALHHSAESYRRKRIIEAMPVAYEAYCARRDAGIPFENPDSSNIADFFKQHRRETIEAIIQGRVLNGEPPDLNF